MEQDLRPWLDGVAKAAGFDELRVTGPNSALSAGDRLAEFVSLERHGEMAWMAETFQRRQSPRALWPDVRSVLMLAKNYGPEGDPLDATKAASHGAIACYAQGSDYHDVVKSGLKQVARALAGRTGAEVKVFVDTAPVMEKPLAAAAGIGWQGKHTNLVSRRFGSWLFLGAIFTTAEIAPDAPEADHCGNCRACLDICPTNAFPAPYQLDARRCISYLTIEHKGPIPHELRKGIGNRIFGCDDCLAVCPWNKFAERARDQRLAAREAVKNPPLAELLALDDAQFRLRFRGTPVKRTGRDRIARNALIAAGNSGDVALLEPVVRLLDDPAPIVRGAAVWALGELVPDGILEPFSGHRAREQDLYVKSEWQRIDPA